MTFRKYLVLLSIVVFASIGDTSLARGMKDYGAVTTGSLPHLLVVLINPWIVGGIFLLIIFYASYLSALSWADLTYVLPATALSYVMMALLGKYVLHENVTLWRWLGVALITIGVGFVASGPERSPGTGRPHDEGVSLARDVRSEV